MNQIRFVGSALVAPSQPLGDSPDLRIWTESDLIPKRPTRQRRPRCAAHLLDALRAAPPRAGATRVLAIDGRSGAGKSTLARALAGELGAPLVALEDLYGGWDGLERGVELLREAVLEPLAQGRDGGRPALRLARGRLA